MEVIRRSDQGSTQPYLCRAEDGELYFVKGRGAGYPSLAREWIAGCLARRLGLPIPDFAILGVPVALLGRDAPAWLSDLGRGPVFGSKVVRGADEIAMADLPRVPEALRRDIAVFDWWLLNGDRTLSDKGGNPNMLWVAPDDGPYIIDHNLALDETVNPFLDGARACLRPGAEPGRGLRADAR